MTRSSDQPRRGNRGLGTIGGVMQYGCEHHGHAGDIPWPFFWPEEEA